MSRARQCLTGTALALGADATFQEMQQRRRQALSRPLPEEVLNFDPDPLPRGTGSQHVSGESEKWASRIFVRTWRLDIRT